MGDHMPETTGDAKTGKNAWQAFALEHFWKGFALLVLGLCFWIVQIGRETLQSLQSTGLFRGIIQTSAESSNPIIGYVTEAVRDQTEPAKVHLKTGSFTSGYLDQADHSGVILRTLYLNEGKQKAVFIAWENISHITVTNRHEKQK